MAKDVNVNVRVTFQITRRLPGAGDLAVGGTVWWLGTRFHVRLDSGLPAEDLLDLAAAERGFGREPRTKEDFMDTRVPMKGVVDVYGDTAAKYGAVVEDRTSKLAVETAELLPMARLVFSGDVTGLGPSGRGRLLGRETNEYTTYRERKGEYRSTERRMVAGAYVLLREVTDEKRAGALLRVETLSLDEGAAREADVAL